MLKKELNQRSIKSNSINDLDRIKEMNFRK